VLAVEVAAGTALTSAVTFRSGRPPPVAVRAGPAPGLAASAARWPVPVAARSAAACSRAASTAARAPGSATGASATTGAAAVIAAAVSGGPVGSPSGAPGAPAA
jgi:hypothetical protein